MKPKPLEQSARWCCWLISDTVRRKTAVKMSTDKEVRPAQPNARYAGRHWKGGDHLAHRHVPHHGTLSGVRRAAVGSSTRNVTQVMVEGCKPGRECFLFVSVKVITASEFMCLLVQ